MPTFCWCLFLDPTSSVLFSSLCSSFSLSLSYSPLSPLHLLHPSVHFLSFIHFNGLFFPMTLLPFPIFPFLLCNSLCRPPFISQCQSFLIILHLFPSFFFLLLFFTFITTSIFYCLSPPLYCSLPIYFLSLYPLIASLPFLSIFAFFSLFITSTLRKVII